MNFVLDASIALSWCFGDESSPVTLSLLDQLETEMAIVPTIWPLELGNILVGAERRKRISHAEISQFLELLSSLNIHIDNGTSHRALHEILALANSEKLTTYDASYLDLAMKLGLPLATKDDALRQAAIRMGVECLI